MSLVAYACVAGSGGGWGKSQWYCGVDEKGRATHARQPFSSVSHVGCGARYRPYARGKGVVCEFGADGCEYSITADLLPEVLDEEIKKMQASRVAASLLLTPEELKQTIPLVTPQAEPCRRVTTHARRPLPDPESKSGRLARARHEGLVAARERDGHALPSAVRRGLGVGVLWGL